MLCHFILDVNHKVLGAWVRYHDVPMQFVGGEFGCFGGYLSVRFEFVSSDFDLHYVSLFLLGPNVVDDAVICELGILGDFMPVYEKASVSSLYIPDTLKNSSNFI